MIEFTLTVDRLPIDGNCIVLNPPGHPPHVYDLVGVDGADGTVARLSLVRTMWRLPADAFCGWGRLVLAPSTGIVHSVHDGEPDRATISAVRDVINGLMLRPLRRGRDVKAMAGNHVIIEIDGGYVLLAHLRRGSVTVERRQPLTSGAVIGEVGNSGNSVAPHLHVQVMNSPDPLLSKVVPWRLRSYELLAPHGRWELVQQAPPPTCIRVRNVG